MRKRKLTAIAVVAIAAVVLAGGLMASNMGFKLNFLLNGSSSSNSGTNYVSLPYNTQVGINTAKDLFLDIGAATIQKHTRSTDQFQIYTFGAGDFSLNAGEAYIVGMGSADLNYIIVGSHDPSAQVQLDGAGTNGSASGTNYYAHPYHAVSATAQDLFLEIGAATLQRHNRASDQFQIYTFGAPNFSLNPGDAYIVNLGAGQNILFTPAHY
jgi:hypothetical protein